MCRPTRRPRSQTGSVPASTGRPADRHVVPSVDSSKCSWASPAAVTCRCTVCRVGVSSARHNTDACSPARRQSSTVRPRRPRPTVLKGSPIMERPHQAARGRSSPCGVLVSRATVARYCGTPGAGTARMAACLVLGTRRRSAPWPVMTEGWVLTGHCQETPRCGVRNWSANWMRGGPPVREMTGAVGPRPELMTGQPSAPQVMRSSTASRPT